MDREEIPMCDCGRDYVGHFGHCLQCELEPFGVAWQLEQQGEL